MRILAIVDEVPFPEASGGAIRIAAMLRGFAQAGEVDLFALRQAEDAEPLRTPTDGSVARSLAAPRPLYRGRSYVQWLRSRWPYELVSSDYGAPRQILAEWMSKSYDLVYLRPLTMRLAFGELLACPIILDMDDFKSDLLAATLRSVGSSFGRQARESSWAEEARRRVWALRMRRDVTRWRRLEREEAHAARLVFVASEFHRQQLPGENVVVVPNPYPAPAKARGEIGNDRTPTITFIGSLMWPPNRDASQRLATEILPLVRRDLPEAQVRLVGTADDDIKSLGQLEGVTVTGQVSAVEEELARADLIAVPIRFAGGTRIKILEAFAHGVPVVSTTTGCEGLEVTNGEQLLVADSPAEFARACVTVLTDPALRQKLVRHARQLYEGHYRSEHVERIVAAAAVEAVANDGRGRQATRDR